MVAGWFRVSRSGDASVGGRNASTAVPFRAPGGRPRLASTPSSVVSPRLLLAAARDVVARPSPGRRRHRSRADTAAPLEATCVSDGESRAWLASEDGLRPYGPPLRPSSFPFIVATCAAVTSGRRGGGGLTAEGGQVESGQMRSVEGRATGGAVR